MARRKLWWGIVSAMALAVGVAAWLPGYRLSRELAAAHREGLWTEAADVRRGIGTVPDVQNAAPLIRAAIAADESDLRSGAFDEAARHLLKGDAKPAQVALLRRDLVAHPARTALWRAASDRPCVDYGRPW